MGTKRRNNPKTETERKATHKAKYGNTDIPARKGKNRKK